MSEDQSWREIIRGIKAYMNWNFVLDVELPGATSNDNPFTGNRSQPVKKGSLQLPADDWFCWKWEAMTSTIQTGYQTRNSEPGGFHTDQFLRPPKSQLHWYGLHPVNPAISHPTRQVSFWVSDAAKLNSLYAGVVKPSGSGSVPPPCHPISQETVQNGRRT